MSLSQGTMVPIYTVTVGAGGQSAIQFNNIPQTYTDLIIMLSVRETLALGSTRYTDIPITINGQTSASGKVIYSNDGSTANSYPPSSAPVTANGGNSTTSTFSNVSIYIPNYTSTGVKSISADSVAENNATAAFLAINAFNITNGAAINSITISATTSLSSTFVQHSSATLYGVKNYALTQIDAGAKASGGIVTSDANYYYHTFTTSGTFTPAQSLTANYLIVAGGGSANGYGGGGGGAGGLRSFTNSSFTAGTNYTVTVGAGGTGASNGSNTTFNGNSASGGGYGANAGGGPGGNGGSGGGAGGGNSGFTSGGSGNSGGYTPVEGYAGGTNYPSVGGGGGGASEVGESPANQSTTGRGGDGSSSFSSWAIATNTGEIINNIGYYAGGGSGGAPSGYGNSVYPAFGRGGYGGGGVGNNTGVGGPGKANTGGGGGGGWWNQGASNGGSGIVIIRYAK